MSAFDVIRSDNLDGAKTNIVEIDRLIEKIKESRSKNSPLPDNIFDDFTARIEILNPVETSILRYYIDGTGIKEISSKMFVTMNTVREHTSHIYVKLGVMSKDEFMLYVELIKKSGLAEKIM